MQLMCAGASREVVRDRFLEHLPRFFCSSPIVERRIGGCVSLVRCLTTAKCDGAVVNAQPGPVRTPARNKGLVAMTYNVTTITTLRPGTAAQALAQIKAHVMAPAKPSGELLACWTSDIGALNQILLIHRAGSAEQGTGPSRRSGAFRRSVRLQGCHDAVADRHLSVAAVSRCDRDGSGRAGVRGANLVKVKAGGMAPTIELWRKAVPDRVKLAALAGLYSVSGVAARFVRRSGPMPASMSGRDCARRRWPRASGRHRAARRIFRVMQSDIYLPADFSPLR